jgi:hypothetical protein
MAHHGIIIGFAGTWMSGMGYLHIVDIETGIVEAVPCENGPTVRALEACFGNVIGNAHNVDDTGGHIGQEIFWDYDEFGLTLGGFTPVDEWDPENDYDEEMEGETMTRNEALKEIHEGLVNGQRQQMVKQIREYGLYDFWPDYKALLAEYYVERGDRLMYFQDAVISYFRITEG